jgi:hypothetical protein
MWRMCRSSLLVYAVSVAYKGKVPRKQRVERYEKDTSVVALMALATLLASVVALVAPKEQGKIVFVRDGARDTHIFMIRALKDWKRGATAGLLDAPGTTLKPA